MKFLIKWAQFINNYQKSTLGGPLTKHFVLQSYLLYVLLRHTRLPNQFRKHCQFKEQPLRNGGGGRGKYSNSIFLGRRENLIWGTWYFIGGLDNPLETTLYYHTLISL